MTLSRRACSPHPFQAQKDLWQAHHTLPEGLARHCLWHKYCSKCLPTSVMPLFKPDIYFPATPAECRTLVPEWAARKPPVSLQFGNSRLEQECWECICLQGCDSSHIHQYPAMAGLHSSVPRALGSSHKAYKMNSEPAALSTFLDHSLVTLTGCLLQLN